ncbi:hypothetical protein GSUB_03175 [Geoalkalibacter subterraneus]|jgi:hypothetical protein|uniref:Uncharacterized protein n=1 Tax=Geoalkalibacter subterraneus TaxID=483547 RepID=A0A0B5FNZ2_9BACT|nr:hypothetical protein GSUB_03175 [Geoalkalibacter subterraneus]
MFCRDYVLENERQIIYHQKLLNPVGLRRVRHCLSDRREREDGMTSCFPFAVFEPTMTRPGRFFVSSALELPAPTAEDR